MVQDDKVWIGRFTDQEIIDYINKICKHNTFTDETCDDFTNTCVTDVYAVGKVIPFVHQVRVKVSNFCKMKREAKNES